MFTESFIIDGKLTELSFRDYISEDDTIYMITGLDEPLFMGYNAEENDWQFLTDVDDSLLDIEDDISEAICEFEQSDAIEEQEN